jgi:hypothetical protein
MKKMIAMVFLLTMSLTPIQSRGATATSPEIYPGRGLQGIKVGSEAKTVKNVWPMEEPDLTQAFVPTRDGGRRRQILVLYRNKGMVLVCEEERRRLIIKRIVVKSPAFVITGTHIRIGSDLGDLRRAYLRGKEYGEFPRDSGKVTMYVRQNQQREARNYLFCHCMRAGVIFTINRRDNRIVAITVMKPPRPGEGFPNVEGIVGVGLSWKELLYPDHAR